MNTISDFFVDWALVVVVNDAANRKVTIKIAEESEKDGFMFTLCCCSCKRGSRYRRRVMLLLIFDVESFVLLTIG